MSKKIYKAIVTGGTRGIGFEIAKRLHADGINVIATGTKANGIPPKGVGYYEVDFLNDESVSKFIKFIKKSKIDILVNNAGINKINKFAEINPDDFDQIIRVNLRTPFLLCQAAIPNMQKNNWGRIINVTSIFGTISKEYRASYSASKFALDGLTIALSAEVSELGILANSVAPGFINTDLTNKVLGQDGISKLQDRIPIKRLGEPNEIASIVSWLVSDQNTYMSGQNLVVDGGFSRV